MIIDFHHLKNKLVVKMIIMICCVILPVIALIMIITNMMINNLQNQLIDSYKNQLELCMVRVDSQLSVIDQNIDRIISQNWAELNMGDQSNLSDIEKYQFWKELKDYRSNLDLVELCYIKTNWNHDVNDTYNDSICSYKESESIRQYLIDTDIIKTINKKYQVVKIGSSDYLFCNINTNSYSFGFVLKIDTILSLMQSTKAIKDEKFFLATKEGDIYPDDSKIKFDMDIERQTVAVGGTTKNMILLSYPSSKIDYSLVRMIPKEEFESQIPVMERLLQFAAFLSIGIIPLLYYAIRKLVLIPLYNLNRAMRQIENQNLDYRIEENKQTEEFQHINRVFNRMASQINQLTIESYEKDIEKLDIEATNLRLQVNPHMLLNSLNMIYSLSQSKNYTLIQNFTLCLVDYFRYTLNQTEKLVKLKDEMKFVDSYLKIQKIRFPNSFTNVFDVEEDLFDKLIPPLLIQNFVENSIKYALKLGSEIEIIVIVKRDGEKLDISICDTGNGMDENTLKQSRGNEPFNDKNGNHIGIWNCRRRLKMYYGDAAILNISSGKNEGTQVWIQIPIAEEGGDSNESVDCG
jgi:two-component system, sensor histidine kinase YesM